MRSLAFIFLLAATPALASTVVSYTASDSPANNPDANGNTANAWIVTSSGVGGGGFVGNSGTNGDGNGAGAGTTAWGIFSLNPNGLADSVHTLAGGALTVGQQIALAYDNGFVGTGGVVGVSLWNAANQNLFEFFFTGGNTNYQINDSLGFTTTAKPFTDDGFNFSFTLTGAGTYAVSLGGTAVSGNLISQTDQNVAKVRVFSFNNQAATTNDVFFNNLAISNTPEPSRALLMIVGLSIGLLRRRKH